jgi:hypothetical protein
MELGRWAWGASPAPTYVARIRVITKAEGFTRVHALFYPHNILHKTIGRGCLGGLAASNAYTILFTVCGISCRDSEAELASSLLLNKLSFA